jgi:hypothetical protein
VGSGARAAPGGRCLSGDGNHGGPLSARGSCRGSSSLGPSALVRECFSRSFMLENVSFQHLEADTSSYFDVAVARGHTCNPSNRCCWCSARLDAFSILKGTSRAARQRYPPELITRVATGEGDLARAPINAAMCPDLMPCHRREGGGSVQHPPPSRILVISNNLPNGPKWYLHTDLR